MRHVIISDKKGFKTRMLIRDSDGDEAADRIGVPDGPPDVRRIDWEQVQLEINNLLVDNGFFTWDKLMQSPSGLNIITLPIRRQLSALYRERKETGKE